MCGIAGFFHHHTLPPSQIEATYRSLRSRGPDGWGVRLFSHLLDQGWQETKEGTGMLLQTRLSIRDTSSDGAQPMKNEDGSVWIIYNGEIYGWEEEAEELRRRGHHFVSHADTEFILHGYEEWGDAVLDHLQGMFAIAILDLRQQRLLIARDRLGEKPLFYMAQDDSFAFASTARALATLNRSSLPLRINPLAVDAFLTHRYIPAPLSIFENIYKLPAAHRLVVDLSKGKPIIGSPQEYWKLTPRSDSHVANLFHSSVDQRLVADRPLGVFLSGGIDSQAIVASIAKSGLFPLLKTFTASFPENKVYDESAPAAEIADRFGFQHRTLPISMAAEDAPRIIADLDEPFADPSAIPTWYLCQAAAQEIVVALTGDGGDELFEGYKRYRVHQRAARFLPRHGKNTLPWSSERLCLKTTRSGRLRRAILGYQLGWEDAYTLRFSALDPLSRAFLQPDFTVQTSYWKKPSTGLSPRDWMLECDRLNYLPEYILRKSDLCGMAHGLELRSPMIDHQFVQAVAGMKSQERFTSPPKQFIIDQIIGSQALLGPKRGFNPPLQEWLHQPFLADLCRELPQELEKLTCGQLAAKRLTTLMKEASHDHRLNEVTWMLVVLTLSLKQLLEK